MWTLACSSGNNTNTSTSPPGSGGTAPIPGGAGKTFVPESIVYEQVSPPAGDRSGFKLVAATLHDYGNLQELFMTVQNMGAQFGCQPAVAAEVDDAAMNPLGSGRMLLNGQMYRMPDGLTVCLAPGDIGIGVYPILSDPVPAAVDRIRYEFDVNLQPTASKIGDVTLDGLTVANAAGPMPSVTGHLTNHGTAGLQNVEVDSYAIDGATNRAYSRGLAGVDSVAPGAQWDFTTRMLDPIADYRTFVIYAIP